MLININHITTQTLIIIKTLNISTFMIKVNSKIYINQKIKDFKLKNIKNLKMIIIDNSWLHSQEKEFHRL